MVTVETIGGLDEANKMEVICLLQHNCETRSSVSAPLPFFVLGLTGTRSQCYLTMLSNGRPLPHDVKGWFHKKKRWLTSSHSVTIARLD